MNSGRIAVAAGKQQAELQIVQQEAVAEESQMREGEGRHRRERERQATVSSAISSELPSTCQ